MKQKSVQVNWKSGELTKLIGKYTSIKDILTALGKPTITSSAAGTRLRKYIIRNNIDISHWPGPAPKNGCKYTYNINIFTDETALSFYLLGAFMTDGSIHPTSKSSVACKIVSKDQDWLLLMRDFICPGRPLYVDSRKGCYILFISNTSISNWLISWGCGPKKSLTLIMPSIPDKFLPDFIRGVIDGDGHIGTTKSSTQVREHTRIQITTGSKRFAEGLSTSLINAGFSNSICKELPTTKKPHFVRGKLLIAKNNVYTIKIATASIKPLLEWAYYDGNSLAMPRKQIAAKRGIANRTDIEIRRSRTS